MTAEYHDRWICCDDDGLHVRGYYFPWGTKHIPYSAIRGVRRVELGVTVGQWRIWGTSNPRYWASLDPKRPVKKAALVLDVGRFVRPFITPDDPDTLEAVLRRRSGAGSGSGGPVRLV